MQAFLLQPEFRDVQLQNFTFLAYRKEYNQAGSVNLRSFTQNEPLSG
jgi:hypothetical protein